MVQLLGFTASIVGGIAAWRLWHTDHTVLWWSLVVAMFFMWSGRQTIRSAYEQAAAGWPEPQDNLDRTVIHAHVMRDGPVRFWTGAHIVATLTSLILGCVGLMKTL